MASARRGAPRRSSSSSAEVRSVKRDSTVSEFGSRPPVIRKATDSEFGKEPIQIHRMTIMNCKIDSNYDITIGVQLRSWRLSVKQLLERERRSSSSNEVRSVKRDSTVSACGSRPPAASITSGRVFIMNTRGQRKALHTWILLVIVQ